MRYTIICIINLLSFFWYCIFVVLAIVNKCHSVINPHLVPRGNHNAHESGNADVAPLKVSLMNDGQNAVIFWLLTTVNGGGDMGVENRVCYFKCKFSRLVRPYKIAWRNVLQNLQDLLFFFTLVNFTSWIMQQRICSCSCKDFSVESSK